jgi:hypothetical protein
MFAGCADREAPPSHESATPAEPATAAGASELAGKWTEINGDGKSIEFLANGRVTTNGPKGDFAGEFSLPEPGHIKLELGRVSNRFNERTSAAVHIIESAGPPILGTYEVSRGRLVITIGDEISTYERKIEAPALLNPVAATPFQSAPESVAARHTAVGESPCAVGTADEPGSRNIIMGSNVFQAQTAPGQSISAINAFLALWLGCAQTDIDNEDLGSAQVRLERILQVLKERQGNGLLIASTQTRLALVALKTAQGSQALSFAKSAADAFEPILAQTGAVGKPHPWLSWGGYDEVTIEPLLALLVLTRAQRANQDPQWAATIETAISTAERTAGRDSEIYRRCVQLRADLSRY